MAPTHVGKKKKTTDFIMHAKTAVANIVGKKSIFAAKQQDLTQGRENEREGAREIERERVTEMKGAKEDEGD